jgi:16S rRNA (cytosine967-C5)-methyltransferase
MSRLVALEILRARHRVSLRAVDRAARQHGLDARDRALVRHIVGTEVRRRGTLRVLAKAFTRGRPTPAVQDCIALGLIQLFFMDTIPDHAAVSETVRATGEMLGDKKAQYVNACLRAAIRARRVGHCGDPRRDLPLRNVHLDVPVFSDPALHPLLWAEEALSMPVPLMKRWVKRYGKEHALEMARNALVEPDLSLRVVRGEREDVERAFEGRVTLRRGHHPSILLASMGSAAPILASELFTNGTITVQGESALRAAELVDARAGERVLDLCAAPGGKTAVLAASGALVTACDDDEKRMVRLRQTVERLAPSATIDARVHDAVEGLEPASFDAVLVDAPCSNTGVLAARPAARWRFSPQSQGALAELQMRLLVAAATCVKPGGRLVYSTCSIEPEENQRRVKAFLAVHADFALDREIEALPAGNGGSGPVDGGYAARMVRSR